MTLRPTTLVVPSPVIEEPQQQDKPIVTRMAAVDHLLPLWLRREHPPEGYALTDRDYESDVRDRMEATFSEVLTPKQRKSVTSRVVFGTSDRFVYHAVCPVVVVRYPEN